MAQSQRVKLTRYVLKNANLPDTETFVFDLPDTQALPTWLAEAGWTVVSSSTEDGGSPPPGFAFLTPADLAPYAKLTDLANLLHKPAGIADGQLVAYSSTTGDLAPVNPTGSGELAFAANVSGSPIGASANGGLGVAVDLLTVVTVPVSNGRPVRVFWGATIQQTVAGLGSAYLSLVETTSAATTIKSGIVLLPNSVASAQNAVTVDTSIRLGAVTSPRTFKLQLVLFAPASNAPAARAVNAGNNPTYIEAVAL